MRKLLLVLSITALSACTSVNYQSFEGDNKVLTGQGGTKIVVDGIEFWDNGSPVRPYKLLGVVEGNTDDGWGAESSIRSAVAAEVKKRGGDAVVLISNNVQFTGVVKAAYADIATGSRTTKFGVIKYL